MKKLNRKGFTLIELLAVIIILAILMTLAITAMSGYIRGARKDTFVTTAQQYANAVRLSFVNGEYDATKMPGRGECLAVSTNSVALFKLNSWKRKRTKPTLPLVAKRRIKRRKAPSLLTILNTT